ncbi:MAG TPA: ion transporter [Methanoregula sp.]|nr:ion transporter [Methanoregula sp.]
MVTGEQDDKELGYEIFIAAVSVLAVFNTALVIIPGIDPDAVNVVTIINLCLTIIFLLDFGYRIATAESRSRYMIHNWGWADLLACLPGLRFLRLFRIFKAYRLLQKNGTRRIVDHLSYNRAESALYLLVFCVIIILEAGAFLVLSAESKAPDANITSATDALWWAYVTITTVGYGDRFPVTTTGRLVGILVMTTGVGIFGTFAGFIANKLLAPKESAGNGYPDTAAVFQQQVLAGMQRLQASTALQGEKLEEMHLRLVKIETILRAE